MRTQPTVTLVLAALALAGAWGCQPPAEEIQVAPPGERVENPQVGVAIAALPGFFQVAVNEGAELVLAAAAETDTGRMTIVAGEPQTAGINLVEAVKGHKQEILAAPDGEYKGQRELGLHLGTAFYSRGRYAVEGGGSEEETAVFLVHPAGDRTLELRYSYPAGDAEDTRTRIEEQLFAVLEELEPLDPQP